MPSEKAPGKTEGESWAEENEKRKEQQRESLKKIGVNILAVLQKQTILNLDPETQQGVVQRVQDKLYNIKSSREGLEQFNEYFNSYEYWVPELRQIVIEAVSRDEDVKKFLS